MWHRLDERGAILPGAIILLLIVTIMLSTYVLYFDAVYRTYDSLESHFLRATINEIEKH